MRLSRLSFVVAAGLVALVSSALAQDGFPPIPRTGVRDGMDKDQLQKLSDKGDGLATLYLASLMDCQDGDTACADQMRALYQKAIAQGETSAVDADRLATLRADPAQADKLRIAKGVCGQTFDGSDALVAALGAIKFPTYKKPPRPPEAWKIERIDGPYGSKLVGMKNSAMSIILIYHDGDLQLARVFTQLLDLGTQMEYGSRERIGRAEDLRKAFATTICPNWAGLPQAIESYLHDVKVTPPRGVHVNGKDAWLAVSAIIPDLAWVDLYVDPFHDPFTTAMPEEFSASLELPKTTLIGITGSTRSSE